MAIDILEAQQIRMKEVLGDRVYRKWFGKAPYIQPHMREGHPWFLYLQMVEDGPWKRAKMEKYGKAYKWVAPKLNDLWDFAITSRRKAFPPPTYRPTGKHLVYWANYPRNHKWCPYCRRPVIFRQFTKHHAITPIRRSILGDTSSEPISRCSICGIREEAVTPWLNLGRM